MMTFVSGPSSTPAVSSSRTSRMACAPAPVVTRRSVWHTSPLPSPRAPHQRCAGPSACSGSIFGNGQMLVMGTIEDPTNPVCELVSTQRIAVRLDHFSLAVYPLGFYGVQPRTLLGKKADNDPHPFCAVLDFSVVRSEPTPDLFGDVPRSVVPDEEQHLLADLFELFATPSEESRRYGTDRPPIHESQPRLVCLGQIESVAGDGLRLRIVFGDRLLKETQRLPFLRPAIEGGQCQPAPPALVHKTHHPGVGIGLGHFHQPVAPPFFLSYRGSGEVIQRFARIHLTPRRRESVARMVSPLTRLSVRPRSKATCAAISKVQRLLSRPNSLGEQCSISRKASACSGAKAL